MLAVTHFIHFASPSDFSALPLSSMSALNSAKASRIQIESAYRKFLLNIVHFRITHI
jgi:hypothetical protein